MIGQLEHFGLSEKESAVYAAALELGPATADQLSKQSGIKRSTTYVQIESLQEMGLMSSYEEGKKTFYAPESPQNLERVLEREQKELEMKQSELKKLLPDLTNMFEGAGERPVVRFYQGKEGIISLRNESLNTKSKKLYVISSNDDLSSILSFDEREKFSQKRSELEIDTSLLYTRSEGKLPNPTTGRTKLAYIPPNKLELSIDTVIFDDCVCMMSLKGSLVGVLIKSKEIADSQKSLFQLLWDSAEKH